MVTPAGLENFFLEVDREAIDEEVDPAKSTDEDIQQALAYAAWLAQEEVVMA